MPTVSGTLPEDDTTADVGDYNPIITAILAVLNGHIDGDNIEPGSLPWSVMSASLSDDIPAAAMEDEGNLVKYRDEASVNFIASGCLWSATSGLDGAMTAGVLYAPDGGREAVAAVSSKTFTASKDTYVDVTPAGAVSYSEVTNGAASPALTTDYTRIAKVVTDGSSVTSVTTSGFDSLENKIRPTSNVPGGSDPVWEELGRTTLGSAGDTITVDNLPARKYLHIKITAIGSGAITEKLTFNNDTGSNYARRNSDNNSADATAVNASTVSLSLATSGSIPVFIDIYITNISAQEKIGQFSTRATSTVGAGTAPYRRDGVIKWANTSAQITRVDINNDDVGSYSTGSEVIVLGHN